MFLINLEDLEIAFARVALGIRDPTIIVTKARIRGFTGEILERESETLVTTSGYEIGDLEIHPIEFLPGQVVEMTTKLTSINFPSNTKLDPDKTEYSVQYSVYGIKQNNKEVVDSMTGYMDCNSYITLPSPGSPVNSTSIISSFKPKREGEELVEISTCTSAATHDHRCAFRASNESILLFIEEAHVTNIYDEKPSIVSQCFLYMSYVPLRTAEKIIKSQREFALLGLHAEHRVRSSKWLIGLMILDQYTHCSRSLISLRLVSSARIRAKRQLVFLFVSENDRRLAETSSP